MGNIKRIFIVLYFLKEFMQKALFSIGFRPFFLLGSFSAFLFPLIWVAIYNGEFSWNHSRISAISWHAHEMLYGVVAALVAGFLLTATANWTGKKPIQGPVLGLLCFFWILERLSFYLPDFLFISLNILFPFALYFLIARTLWDNKKNIYIISAVLILFFLGKYFLLYGEIKGDSQILTIGKYLSVGALRFLFILILGRVLPFFSSKRFPELTFNCPKVIQIGTLVSFFLIIIPWEQLGFISTQLVLNIIALIFLGLRIPFYLPHLTYKEPMILILNFGLLWPFIGLFFSILGFWHQSFVNNFLQLHAFMAGLVGTIGLGMMCRVSLGHSGREIKADSWILIIFIFVTLGTAVRVFAPFFGDDIYPQSLYFAASLWSLAFLIYFIRFFKILITPRFGI